MSQRRLIEQAFPLQAKELMMIAPELAFSFRVVLSAEGQALDEETRGRLNEVLGEVKEAWRLL